MAAQVEKISGSDGDMERIEKAARLIEAGGLVAFPTETVYGVACRVRRDSLIRLNALKGCTPDKHYTLHIGQADERKTYVPNVGLRTEKLIRQAWPGPLTLVFEIDPIDMIKQKDRVDNDVFDTLYKNGAIGIRCPDHVVASTLLRSAQCPVVAPSANVTGEEPATDASHAAAQLADQIDLILDGGPCKHRKSSTVAKVSSRGIEVLREGVYSRADLEAMAQIVFLFVCTGNTCRSAMAEGLFRMHLAKKIGCDIDELAERGYKVVSAGTMDVAGAPASSGAFVACHHKGVDMGSHVSQHLTRSLVEASDFIFCMTESHCEQVRLLSSGQESNCSLLAKDSEIPDPIGQSQEFFDRCADIIEAAVKARVGEFIV